MRWLAPKELTRTAVKVGLAAVFADYSDKREIQGALEAGLLRAPLADPSAEEIWIDFVADLGDGFEATASVASALAEDRLAVAGPGPLLVARCSCSAGTRCTRWRRRPRTRTG